MVLTSLRLRLRKYNNLHIAKISMDICFESQSFWAKRSSLLDIYTCEVTVKLGLLNPLVFKVSSKVFST